MKPITPEEAWANGYGYALAGPYLPHEGWMLANAIEHLDKGRKSYALVLERHSCVHDKEGISIYLKGARNDTP